MSIQGKHHDGLCMGALLGFPSQRFVLCAKCGRVIGDDGRAIQPAIIKAPPTREIPES